ncbi:MAG: hypothetical protein GC151_13770 [Betaproteobacteria bacterium]|nr:hypothetical protein [Betaproteobacteria bacterium]
MPRGRKPATFTPTEPPAINEKALSEDTAAVDKRAGELITIDQTFGVQVYNRERLIAEAHFFCKAAGEALVELGRRLVVLREHEPHGEWLDALQQIGIEPRFAQRAMQAAVKFAPEHAKRLAHLGQSKMLELLVLDDEQIAELNDGGTVAGLQLDDVDRMSVRELRDALRKARAQSADEHEISERLLGEKNKKIDDLAAELARKDALPEFEGAADAANRLWQGALGAAGGLTQIALAFRDIGMVYGAGDAPEAVRTAQRHTLTFLMQLLVDVQVQNGIDIDLTEMVTPPWIEDFRAQAKAAANG